MALHQLLVTILTSLIFAGAAASADCGKSPGHSDLVVRGSKIDPGDWPWIAALFYQNETALQFQCGATLVSRTEVVTAAHCVRKGKHNLPADKLMVTMGRHHLYNWTTSPTVQLRYVNEVVIHPSYLRLKKSGSDLAVLKWTNPIDVTDQVSPICTWRSEFDDRLGGVNGTVVGWGMDEDGNLTTEEPRLTRMPLVPRQTCLDSHEDFQPIVHDYTFCAGKRDGTGPCSGDSGSGMFVLVRRSDGRRRWALRGLVSRSIKNPATGLCDLRHYVVFTDMAKTADWVRDQRVLDLLWVQLGDRFYYFTEAQRNWAEAKKFCCEQGLELAAIETKEENDLVMDHKMKIYGNNTVWLGGTDEGHESRWVWSGTQRELTYTNWTSGQPDGGARENCMSIGDGAAAPRHWFDRECSEVHRFICEL